MPDIAVSRIAGRGLFADASVRAGADVMSVADDPVGPDDLGLLNHSCDPSLGWSGARSLVALRNLAVGDELTVDYATCIDDDDFVLYCHCETYRCRQLIEGRDWQIPQLQTRYAGRWTPALQRRIDHTGG